MARRSIISALVLAGVVFPAAAHAHVAGPAHDHGWLDGALHPLTGIDHLAAMLGVGFLGASRIGWAKLVPAAGFLFGMIAGLLSGAGGASATVEMGVTLSLLAIGALLVFAGRRPVWTDLLIVLVAGWAHGAVHASESPGGWSFAAGALLMTAILHTAGLLAGLTLGGQAVSARRVSGLALAAVGLGLVFQIV
jgi:urease accessory protein